MAVKIILATILPLLSMGCAARMYHKPELIKNAYKIEHSSWPDCKVDLQASIVTCKCQKFLMETAPNNDVVMKCPQ